MLDYQIVILHFVSPLINNKKSCHFNIFLISLQKCKSFIYCSRKQKTGKRSIFNALFALYGYISVSAVSYKPKNI